MQTLLSRSFSRGYKAV